MDFSGRHVVITGGAGALGTALVEALVNAGAMCHVPCMDEAEAQRFRLRDNRQVALTVTGSLTDENAVARLYDGITPLWASIHLAGGFAAGPLRDTSVATLRGQIEMNFVSCLLCCRAAVKSMAGDGGRIVNVAARPALEWRSGAGMAAYAASKAAVAALTAALAEEVVKDGILVNAVAPSTMDTPANRRAMPKANFDLWPKVEEVSATILFLASPDNRVTRGGVVPVYGKSYNSFLAHDVFGKPVSAFPDHALIPGPKSRRRQLEEVTVGIAEINALAAARPFGAAFDGDVRLCQPLFPSRQLIGGDREGDVHRPMTVMRRNGAAGQMHGFERAAAQKQQQHAAAADVVGAQPLIAVNAVEPEQLFVERTGALEFLDIERGFKNAEQVGHGLYRQRFQFPLPLVGTG